MSNVFDNAAKAITISIPLGPANTADAVINAVKNGAAYAQVPFDMDIDQVFLDFSMSSNVNSAGSGNFGVGVYADNVSLTSAQIGVAYSSANPYTSVARANLSKTSLDHGDLLRVDILEVPGGAATSYPTNAVVRITGTSR